MDSGADRATAAATHGPSLGPAIDRLKNAPIAEVVVTNTLPLPAGPADRQDRGACRWPASSPTPSGAVFEDASVSEIFNDQNQL